MKLGFIQPALSVLILTQLTHDMFSNCVASYNVDMEKVVWCTTKGHNPQGVEYADASELRV
jgi:hypothetical protein